MEALCGRGSRGAPAPWGVAGGALETESSMGGRPEGVKGWSATLSGCCFWEAEEEKGRSQALSQPRDLSPIPISGFCPSIFVGTSLAPAMIMELVVSS